MIRPAEHETRWPALGVAVVLLGCGGSLLATDGPVLALINESPSVPRGVYVRVPGAEPRRGDTVALPQPAPARAYLGGLGMPADVRLLKRIAAVKHDRVCQAGDQLTVADRVVMVRSRDSRGTALSGWRGCRRLAAGEVFLLGDTPGSFDSRYFGPVRVSDLDGVFRETLTW